MAYTPSLSDIPAQAPQASASNAPAGNQSTAQASPTPAAGYTPSLSDVPGQAPTDFPSKALAATGSMTGGMLKGIGQTLEAGPNIAGAVIQHGLNLLNSYGIVPDSIKDQYSKGRQKMKDFVEGMGQKVLDFQQIPSKEDQTANPTISKVGNVAGNMLGSTLAAGAVVGNLGLASGLSRPLGMAINQGAQGVLMGAGSSDSPLTGGAIGGAIGGTVGSVVGKLSRTGEVINDKIDDATRLGFSPYSEQGIKSIKGALDNNGKELTTEEIERQTNIAMRAKLDALAPDVEIKQSPVDTIVNQAAKQFPIIQEQKNALYAPLNESKAPVTTPMLDTALVNVNKNAQSLLPDKLPENPTLGDLMTYRRQVSAGINQSERAIKMGSPSGDFKSLQQLIEVKKAVTTDLNAAADKVGLSGQLQKADQFHATQYKPFEVYDTESGKLQSPQDMQDAWSKVSRLLKQKMPNLTAMSQVASTLGPQGKQLFGYGYMEQALNRSMNVDERIFPSKVSTELNKLENSGLAQHILTPELKEAFQGLRNIAEGAIKTTKGSPAAKGAIADFIKSATHSSAGITLLRALGSKTTPAAKIKNVIGQILLNAVEKQSGQYVSQQEDQQ